MRRFALCIGMISVTGFAEPCSIGSSEELVACVVANHPNVLVLGSEVEVAQAGIEKAGQRPNPNLSSEVLLKAQGDLRLGAGYTHILERRGKADARADLARAEVRLARSKILSEKESVAVEALRRLFAISQINESCDLIHEILSIYNSGLSKYNRQQYLSPELEVERDILKVAKEEMLSRESINNSAKLEHLAWLRRAAGADLPKDEAVWLPRLDFWKKVEELPARDSSASLVNKSRIAEAQGQLRLEEAVAYSDVRVGPVFEIEREDGEWKAGIGVGVSLDLPFYHRNEGAALVASKQVVAATARWERQRELEAASLEVLKEKYENAVSRLREIDADSPSKKLHEIIDRRAQSGLFRPQTIIEAHRQLVESLERKQEIEQIAINAKWEISLLNGALLPPEESSDE